MPGSPAAGGSVTRNSLRQQIADALRDEVLTGRLQAGRHFTVKEIAELYGVSATPVREALVDLAAQGLLDIEHHRGFQVRRFSHKDFREMVDARTLVIEGAFGRMTDAGSMGEIPAAAIASVRRRAEAAARAALSGELHILIGYDLRFWREIAALGGNPHICEFLDRIRVQTWVYAVPLLRAQPCLAGLCWAEHLSLVDAVADGDTAAAQRIVYAYNDHYLALMDKLAGARPGPES
ncbi:GntR family transcriptional regulator [Actinacidiphila oryziradicis]|jgi:DNA-binding GntR family transcriptional regulator|uniref:GntR family transcriptional regulator n=1 Tax=Actinacidiphila oryziradicis TaxID=2571141 RepID=UPI0023F2E029|nr:GntR family transcriptional regulator [Actinacidiphila oryziradicis]MCW2871490.1 transcriptional regulator [Actinacidiphila oryziradicis]